MTSPNAGTGRRAATAFIFITVMLDMLTFGMIGPVLPKLVAGFVGENMAHAAAVIGLFATAWAVMQFFMSPLLGMISDRVGRRPVILLSNAASVVDYVIMALAPNLLWLFAGRVLSGAASANMTAAGAYIADVTPPEKRAKAFGLLGSAFGLGFILGPAIGGLIGNLDPRLTFWGAAAVSMLNTLYGMFVLPESLAPAQRTAHLEWKRANPLGSLALLRSHHELWGLSWVNFIGYLAHEIFPNVWVIFCIAVFGWSTGSIGLTLALAGAIDRAAVPVAQSPSYRTLRAENAFDARAAEVFADLVVPTGRRHPRFSGFRFLPFQYGDAVFIRVERRGIGRDAVGERFRRSGVLKLPDFAPFHGTEVETDAAHLQQDYIIQEYVIGVPLYIHYFYSPLDNKLEIMSMDRRYETNVDSLGRIPAAAQGSMDVNPSYVVVGNQPVSLRESMLAEALRMGDDVVRVSKEICGAKGLFGAFCIETIITPDIQFYVMEISARIVAGTNLFIDGSPYSYLNYSEPMSTGRRIAREIKNALLTNNLRFVLDDSSIL